MPSTRKPTPSDPAELDPSLAAARQEILNLTHQLQKVQNDYAELEQTFEMLRERRDNHIAILKGVWKRELERTTELRDLLRQALPILRDAAPYEHLPLKLDISRATGE